jgi:hypothetical protein
LAEKSLGLNKSTVLLQKAEPGKPAEINRMGMLFIFGRPARSKKQF